MSTHAVVYGVDINVAVLVAKNLTPHLQISCFGAHFRRARHRERRWTDPLSEASPPLFSPDDLLLLCQFRNNLHSETIENRRVLTLCSLLDRDETTTWLRGHRHLCRSCLASAHTSNSDLAAGLLHARTIFENSGGN